jgi:hypothetical protein
MGAKIVGKIGKARGRVRKREERGENNLGEVYGRKKRYIFAG